MKWKNEKDKLYDLIVNQEMSYEEIGRMYGCSGANIKNAAVRLGLPIKKRREVNDSETFNRGTAKEGTCLNCGNKFVLHKSSTGKFCSVHCQCEYEYHEYIRKWKAGEVDGTKNKYDVSRYVRRYIFEKNNSCCEVCGENLVNPYTGKSILQIHHIDGNCLNNREENLQLLCPNHHAMTENFGHRNKNGNKDRTKYYGKDKPRKKTL